MTSQTRLGERLSHCFHEAVFETARYPFTIVMHVYLPWVVTSDRPCHSSSEYDNSVTVAQGNESLAAHKFPQWFAYSVMRTRVFKKNCFGKRDVVATWTRVSGSASGLLKIKTRLSLSFAHSAIHMSMASQYLSLKSPMFLPARRPGRICGKSYMTWVYWNRYYHKFSG